MTYMTDKILPCSCGKPPVLSRFDGDYAVSCTNAEGGPSILSRSEYATTAYKTINSWNSKQISLMSDEDKKRWGCV